VAVGTSDIVQAVNDEIGISSRGGTTLAMIPFLSFFQVLAGQFDYGDPRVLWDAVHSRWIASLLSFDCATGHLYVAISAGADPMGTWNIYHLDFPGTVPDYPGLGISSDKVVISANQYPIVPNGNSCWLGAYAGATLDVIDWATLLAGGASPYVQTSPSRYLAMWRPATALSSTSTLPAIVETANLSTGSWDVGYATISGTIAGGTVAVSTVSDLTTIDGVPRFNVPPTPPGSTAFSDPTTMDGRPTDALWQNGHLWFVSTDTCVPTGDTVVRDCVRVTSLDTSTATPTLSQDFLEGSAGHYFFMGGIGLAGNGSVYVVSSVSSSTTFISTYSAVQLAGDPPNTFGPLTLVKAGQAIYVGQRWGDYVGVAQDPAQANAVWQADEYPNASGGWSTWISQLAPPTPPGAPTGATAFAGNASATVSWSAPSGNGGSPITSYTVTSSPGTKHCTWTSGPISCTVTGLTNGTAYTFTVRATNAIGTGPASSPSVVVYPPFADIAGSPFVHDIIWVYLQGITSGCTATAYCPNDPVSRAQMATFLARALHLSGAAPDAFTDDNGSIYEPNINLVAQAGIASGCGGTLFCPNGLVSRAQMATFLARALHLSGPAPDAFTDDNGSIYEPNINLVAREGIATGCGGTLFCPNANVTRGQMAAFLHRAFGP
jgi:hypothetical protein